jgi:hypothetical protein
LSKLKFNSLERNAPEPDYDAMRTRKDCRNTAIFCVLSLGLLIAAFMISNPAVAASLPGGPATVLFLGILIIVSVFLLCYWQRPRRG